MSYSHSILSRLFLTSLVLTASLLHPRGLIEVLFQAFITALGAVGLIVAYSKSPPTFRPKGLAVTRNVAVQSFLIPLSIICLFGAFLFRDNFAHFYLLLFAPVACLNLKPIKASQSIISIFLQFVRGNALFSNHDEFLAYKWHSTGTVDLITQIATEGFFTYEELKKYIALADSYDSLLKSIRKEEPQVELNPLWLMNLARLVALQPINTDDLKIALKLYQFVWINFGPSLFKVKRSKVSQQHLKVFLDLLVHFKEKESWNKVLNTVPFRARNGTLTAIDKEHPELSFEPNALAFWEKEFNKEFRKYGLEELHFNESGLSLFDSIECSPRKEVSGPLVTVIVSAFNPGHEILTSVKSICSQSWSNLEIIIVDDASENDEYINQCALLDGRVKVLRQVQNKGTYSARNLAIANSTGDFITTLDSDDWMHPQRIERHVLPMMSEPKILATISRGLRTHSDLLLSSLGFSPFRQNASSLTFRRELVDEIGGFDEVRKGADSEFDARISAAHPKSISLIGLEPLSLIRIGSDSLSRTEIRPMWIHPARQSYRSAYSRWHEVIKCSSDQLSDSRRSNRKEFEAPMRFMLENNSRKFDLVIAGSFTQHVIEKNGKLLDELKFLSKLGKRVAILQIEPLAINQSLHNSIQDMLNSGLLSRVIEDESTFCNLLLFRHIWPLQIHPVLEWGIKAEQTFVATENSYQLDRRSNLTKNQNSRLKWYLNPSRPQVDLDYVLTNLSSLNLHPIFIPIDEAQRSTLETFSCKLKISTSYWSFDAFVSKHLPIK